MRCCSDRCPTRSTTAIKSLIIVPVYIVPVYIVPVCIVPVNISRYLKLDSYHGTQSRRPAFGVRLPDHRSIPPQRICVRLDLNL